MLRPKEERAKPVLVAPVSKTDTCSVLNQVDKPVQELEPSRQTSALYSVKSKASTLRLTLFFAE